MSEPLRVLESEALDLREEETTRSLRLLVIVDEPAAAGAVRAALAGEPGGVDVEWVHSLAEGMRPLRREPFDLVVLDMQLVGNHSLELIDEPALASGDTWLVLLAEPEGPLVHPRRLLERVAQEALPRSERLADDLGRLFRFARRTVDLRARASRYQSLFRHSCDGILLFDAHGVLLDANPRAVEQLGHPRDELLGLRIESLHPAEEGPRVRSALREIGGTGAVTLELAVQRHDGTTFPAEVSASSFHSGGRRLVQAVVRDLSARRALEGRLLQVQKMEALGRLAGGVAHDLNNLLTVIHGYGSLLRDALHGSSELLGFLDEIGAAGQRAAALTRQLLAFSRRQVLQPRLLDLNEDLASLQRLLQRTLGEDVRLAVDLAPDLPRVRIDPGQLEQVVVNLALNARDAMPRGGQLTLATSAAPPPMGSEGEGAPGATPWVRLVVRDTGHGMPPEVLRHAFEPFFTTKERGKGSGLGLAAVYGIVKQSGGDIRVQSVPGEGTVFEILLPPGHGDAPNGQQDTGEHTALGRVAPRGDETILVVEDDTAVRRLMRMVLRGAGYRVLEAEDGEVALALAGSSPEPIALLVCDVVLPDLGGIEVARQVTALCPRARVLFVSGHPQEAMTRQGRLPAGSRFLAKPFAPDTLLDRVAHMLARPARRRD